MIQKRYVQALTLLLTLVLFSAAAADHFIIYDPCGSESASDLYQILQDEQYAGIITDDIESELENLNDYEVLFVIADWWCEGFDLDLLNSIADDIQAYLENGGAIYWEGENTAFFSDQFRDDIFQFDIATCASEEPSDEIRGYFDSPFEVEVSTEDIYATMLGGGDGAAFEADDICWCKGIYRETPFKAILNSIPFSIFTDGGPNTRVEFVNEIMSWLLTPVDVPEATAAIPDKISSIEAYPNPFNAQTQIRFSISKATDLRIVVYNILGQPVETVYDGYSQAGEHSLYWDASGYSTGIYFARIESSDFTVCEKLVLLK